ncbi:MAG: hypothetical protein HY816_04295 [Candidatus Wallbacteria bacterium]|nr:hypothetical protein [Candidatus Wallbacteria bacterium]
MASRTAYFLLATVLMSTLLASACGDSTKTRVAEDSAGAEPVGASGEASSESTEATSATTGEEPADSMGDRRKLTELRDLWDARQYAYIVPMAEALSGRPNLDPLVRLEVCWLLTQAYQGTGERDKASEALKKYEKLKEELVKGDLTRTEGGTRTTVQRLVGEIRKRRQENLAPEDRQRQNELVAEKLAAAGEGAVVELEADTGGKIYCSKDADALARQLSGSKHHGQEPVISHDTEFDYYFAIEEEQAAPAPDAAAAGGGR